MEAVSPISPSTKLDERRIELGSYAIVQVVDEYGWPGHDLVGEEGSQAAWLLAQHADHDLDFQRRCLVFLQDAVDRGQAAPGNLAYLVDRIRVNEERPQVYGTQYHAPDGVKTAPPGLL